jgi:glycine cleavage system aminomethyltransferase T
LEIDDEAKQIVHELGAAINAAVEASAQVAAAIERLREAGYEMELTLRLEIGLRPYSGETSEDGGVDATLELTDEDMRTLRRMRIRIDESD